MYPFLTGILTRDVYGNRNHFGKSFSAKELIRGLLKTDPDERLTINEVMANKWIAVSVV